MGNGNRGLLFKEMKFQFLQGEKSSRDGCDEGYLKISMYFMTFDHTLKMVKMANFTLWIFYHNKKFLIQNFRPYVDFDSVFAC